MKKIFPRAVIGSMKRAKMTFENPLIGTRDHDFFTSYDTTKSSHF